MPADVTNPLRARNREVISLKTTGVTLRGPYNGVLVIAPPGAGKTEAVAQGGSDLVDVDNRVASLYGWPPGEFWEEPHLLELASCAMMLAGLATILERKVCLGAFPTHLLPSHAPAIFCLPNMQEVTARLKSRSRADDAFNVSRLNHYYLAATKVAAHRGARIHKSIESAIAAGRKVLHGG